MEMKSPPNKSHLTKIGYDADTRELGIEFEGGRTYVFSAVEPEKYAGLMAAESHGTYFNANIKGRYAQYRLEEKSGG